MTILLPLLLVGGYGVYSCSSSNSSHKTDQRATNTALPSLATSQPTDTAPYDAAAIIRNAEKAYQAEDYAGAVVLLSELRADDLNRPKTQALWKSANARLDRKRSVQDASDRAEYASNYESALLGAGMDVTVRAQGAGNKTLYLSYSLMSRPLVYQIMTPNAQADSDLAEGHVWRSIMDDRTDLPSLWRSKGFERVIFTDGFETEWKYSLD